MYSTLADYLQFVPMLVNGGEWNGARILQPQTIGLMGQYQLGPGVGVRVPMWHMSDTTFGLGFALKEAPARAEPKSAVGEYCMTQRMSAFWHPFSRDFKRMVYEIAS